MSERDAIVAVTEADREAAWPFYGCTVDYPATHEFKANWMLGRMDDKSIIQAFARHRATHAGEVERLREALRPFATLAETFVGDDGWVGPMNKERIVDWFGPSDFSIARQAMIDTSPIDTYEMEPIDTSFGVGEG